MIGRSCSRSSLKERRAELGTMSPPQLRAKYRRLFKAEPPNVGPSLLSLALAYRLQEKGKGKGGVSSEHGRQLPAIANQLAKDGTVSVDAASELVVPESFSPA